MSTENDAPRDGENLSPQARNMLDDYAAAHYGNVIPNFPGAYMAFSIARQQQIRVAMCRAPKLILSGGVLSEERTPEMQEMDKKLSDITSTYVRGVALLTHTEPDSLRWADACFAETLRLALAMTPPPFECKSAAK